VRLALTLTAALALGGCITGKTYEWRQVPGPVRSAQSVSEPPSSPPAIISTAPPAPPMGDLVDDFVRTANDRVYFDTDRWVLSSYSRETLDRQLDWLNRHPDVTVRIEGNADYRGTDKHNYWLGERRAEAVRGYLINAGFPAHRIATVSYGESRPQEPGRDPASLARNRNARTVIIKVGER
jgi:peptidoglycan-associated lipoprotein